MQAIAHGTFKSDGAGEELNAFSARLQALASAQEVLIKSRWDSAEVGEVLTRAMQAMPQSRIALEGPVALLQPNEALGLALAIHELCTNASKYGALATRTGSVAVQWATEGSMLNLRWQESGGKPVSKPVHRGFGSRILERVIRRDGGGSLELDYAPEGLICCIKLPVLTPE